MDHSNDPAGCQPSTFDTPMAQMPSVRVNRQGNVDPDLVRGRRQGRRVRAREAPASLPQLRAPALGRHCALRVRIPRPAHGAAATWTARATDAGWAIAGNCLFVGHANGAGVRHAINIFKIQPNPEKQPPVQVGEIPAMVEGNEGFDDRELRSLVYRTSRGQDRYLLVRNAGTNTLGRMQTYQIDANTCLPTARARSRTSTHSRTSSSSGTTRPTPIACSST